jgi:hypothetical protein
MKAKYKALSTCLKYRQIVKENFQNFKVNGYASVESLASQWRS